MPGQKISCISETKMCFSFLRQVQFLDPKLNRLNKTNAFTLYLSKMGIIIIIIMCLGFQKYSLFHVLAYA